MAAAERPAFRKCKGALAVAGAFLVGVLVGQPKQFLLLFPLASPELGSSERQEALAPNGAAKSWDTRAPARATESGTAPATQPPVGRSACAAGAAARRFKALVLTYDAHHMFARHMIASYAKLWKEHPFEFLVPYNSEVAPVEYFAPFSARVVLVRTNKSLSGTMLQLLAHCNCPDDLVYFAVDDKYPTHLSPARQAAAIEWMRTQAGNPRFGALRLGYMRALNDRAVNLSTAVRFKGCEANVEIVKCRGRCPVFWAHYFVRAWMLDMLYKIGEDLERRGKIRKAKHYDSVVDEEARLQWHGFDFWTIRGCAAEFAECTTRGKVTRNTLQLMQEANTMVPQEFLPASRHVLTLGCTRR